MYSKFRPILWKPYTHTQNNSNNNNNKNFQVEPQNEQKYIYIYIFIGTQARNFSRTKQQNKITKNPEIKHYSIVVYSLGNYSVT
jgi:hypothetical protein